MSFATRIATTADVLRVFGHVVAMRVPEMTATSFHDDPSHLAHELLILRKGAPANHVTLYALCDGDWPAAICGTVLFGPGFAGMVWVATPGWRAITISTHRWWRQVFVPCELMRYRRVEFTALAADAKGRRWLKFIGFTEEGIAYRQGKCGEDFVHCAWINPNA
jgi:hypothetical protein